MPSSSGEREQRDSGLWDVVMGAILPFGWAVDLYGRFTFPLPPIGIKLFLKKCVKSNIPAEVGETPEAPRLTPDCRRLTITA